MPVFRRPPSLRDLGGREHWLVALTYALFACASFSIAGMDAAVLLLYAVLLLRWRREPTWQELPRWLVWSFFLVPAVSLVAALANGIEAPPAAGVVVPDHLQSLLHLRHLYRLVLPLALLPALAHVRVRRLLMTVLVPAGLMAVYAVIQFYWGVDWYRPVGRKVITPYDGAFAAAGTFSHHLTFGGVMMMLVLLFCALAWLDRGLPRWVWAAGAVLGLVAVLASLGRSDWVGLLVGLVLLAGGFPRRVVRPLVLLAVVLALSAGLVGTGWLSRHWHEPQEPALVRRLFSSTLADNRERLHLWESALMGIRDRPLLGVGYYNYRPYAVAYRTQMIHQEGVVFHIGLDAQMHNTFLQVAFGLGLVGLVAFLAWWAAIFWWNHRSLVLAAGRLSFERGVLYGASAALAGILVAGMFENNFFDAEVQTLIMMLIAVSLHAGLRIRREVAGAGAGAIGEGPGGAPRAPQEAPPGR